MSMSSGDDSAGWNGARTFFEVTNAVASLRARVLRNPSWIVCLGFGLDIESRGDSGGELSSRLDRSKRSQYSASGLLSSGSSASFLSAYVSGLQLRVCLLRSLLSQLFQTCGVSPVFA